MPDALDLATVEASSFEALLHEKFSAQFWDEDGASVFLDFELVGVVPSRFAAAPGRRRSFSLFFRGPAGAALDQSSYRLSHAATGELELFLVPVELQGDRLRLKPS